MNFPGASANQPSPQGPPLQNPYTWNPYAPPPPPPAHQRKWIKWVLLLAVIFAVGGGLYIGWAGQNRQPSNRAWTYCGDLEIHQSDLGIALTDDLINANMTPEQLETAITQSRHGWITHCSVYGEILQGDSANISIAFTFADKTQITHHYKLVHIMDDTPLQPRQNNWRIDAQGWTGASY